MNKTRIDVLLALLDAPDEDGMIWRDDSPYDAQIIRETITALDLGFYLDELVARVNYLCTGEPSEATPVDLLSDAIFMAWLFFCILLFTVVIAAALIVVMCWVASAMAVLLWLMVSMV